jgi:hypothetical protein
MSSSPTLFTSHHRDDLNNTGMGLSMITNAKLSQMSGQRVGEAILEKDSQNAQPRVPRRIAGSCVRYYEMIQVREENSLRNIHGSPIVSEHRALYPHISMSNKTSRQRQTKDESVVNSCIGPNPHVDTNQQRK